MPENGQSTSTPTHSETKKLMSFWDLVGSKQADKVTPASLLKLEASTEMSIPKANIPERNDSRIIEVDPTANKPITSPGISLVGGRKIVRKSRKDEFRQADN